MKSGKVRKKMSLSNKKDNIQLSFLALPAFLYFFVFHYLPMSGAIVAFKSYNYRDGIFGSKWVGFEKFKFFLTSPDFPRLVRNTVGYNLLFIVLGTIVSVAIAMLLFEVNGKKSLKFYQTSMMLPRFLSWVMVAFITYAILDPRLGVANNIIRSLGGEPIQWYTQRKYWPFILVIVNTWKIIGLNSVMYYSSLLGTDQEIFEAARVDGASRWRCMWHISLPSIIPLIITLTLLALGGIFRGDFGLFYQIPRNMGALFPVTDVFDTYIYRMLSAKKGSDLGMTAAAGLFQSVVCMITVLASNAVVKKISKENALL